MEFLLMHGMRRIRNIALIGLLAALSWAGPSPIRLGAVAKAAGFETGSCPDTREDTRCSTPSCFAAVSPNPEHEDVDCLISADFYAEEDCVDFCHDWDYEEGDAHGVDPIWCGSQEQYPFWFCGCWTLIPPD